MLATLAVDGRPLHVPGEVSPSTRLLDVLRSHASCAPKLGCGEGGCGACAVLVSRLDPATGCVETASINACLAPVGSLDGCAITTAEGLGNSRSGFHAIQDALATNFASQCGFCTPGVTVALAAAAAAADSASCNAASGSCGGGGCSGGSRSCSGASDEERAVGLARGLDGNLCRCTGWRPIIDACREIADVEDLCSSGSSGGSSSCGRRLPPLPPFPDWLRPYAAARAQQLAADCAGGASARPGSTTRRDWLTPQSLRQLAAALRRAGGRVRLVAGNTAAGVFKDLWPDATSEPVIALHEVAELRAIRHQQGGVLLGAGTTLQQLLHVLRGSSGSSCDGGRGGSACGAPSGAWAAMGDHLERVAGVHVRSAATLGGHLALCAARPLQTDLGLLLAAAGAQLQLLSVHLQPGCCEAPQQELDLTWQSVEEYLAASCIGGGSAGSVGSASSASSSELLTADAIAGASVLPPASAPTAAAVQRVVTAVWLPYADDRCELLCSYKLANRHVNSHAHANAALWLRFSPSPDGGGGSDSVGGSGDGSGSGGSASSQQRQQRLSAFAGAVVASARLFVGFAPSPPADAATGGAAPEEEDRRWAMSHWRLLRATRVEQALQGAAFTVQGLIDALRQLEAQLASEGLAPSSFSAQALQGMLFKALVPLLHPGALAQPHGPPRAAAPRHAPAQLLRLLQLPAAYDPRVLPRGRQVLPPPPAAGSHAGPGEGAPLHEPVEKDAVRLQASGEALFSGDVPPSLRGRMLYLSGVRSPVALAQLAGVDSAAALELPGVVGVLTARDVPGSNEVFGAPLLAEHKVEYVGQLVALVAATSQASADAAAKLVQLRLTAIPGAEPIITIQQAIDADSWHPLPLSCAAAVKPQPAPAGPGRDAPAPAPPGAAGQDAPARDAAGALPQPEPGAAAAAAQGASAAPDAAVVAGVDALIAASPRRVAGTYELPAQLHFYMEPQVARAEPGEDGCVRVVSATQSLDAAQKAVADVLGLGFHQVSVAAKRLGGGFGGKASRSMPVAACAALAAAHFRRPAIYSLTRNEDFAVNAGRCAGRLSYEAGFRDDGKLVALNAQVILRAGAHLDLAFNDAAQLLAASDSAYNLAGLAVQVKLARCNLPPHTIVRGPGYLQGVMVLEQILEHIAAALGKDAAEVKAVNFLPEITSSAGGSSGSGSSSGGDGGVGASASASSAAAAPRLCAGSPAGLQQQLQRLQPDAAATSHDDAAPAPAGVRTALGRFIPASSYTLPRVWRELLATSGYEARLAAVRRHNTDTAWSKRGIAVTPVRFDCSPAAVGASLSVYADGTVLVTHGGIEMGQGLSTKVKQAAAAALSELLPPEQRPLPLSLVRLAPSSSETVPNAGPTWSSTGSEGNCQAVMNAAAQIVARLRPSLKVGATGVATWRDTVAAQFGDGAGFAPSAVCLTALGYFDGSRGGGGGGGGGSGGGSSGSSSSVAVKYSAFGAAVTEVELDVLTGERRVLSTDIVYDCGWPLNPRIDLGQVEGAFVMGLGVMLCEEVVVEEASGVLLSDSTWEYKIPTPDLIPQAFTVSFLADAPNPVGIAGSKASGEPALMASTSALLALQQAAAAGARELAGLRGAGGAAEDWAPLAAPATPERLKRFLGPVSLADALQAAAQAARA